MLSLAVVECPTDVAGAVEAAASILDERFWQEDVALRFRFVDAPNHTIDEEAFAGEGPPELKPLLPPGTDAMVTCVPQEEFGDPERAGIPGVLVHDTVDERHRAGLVVFADETRMPVSGCKGTVPLGQHALQAVAMGYLLGLAGLEAPAEEEDDVFAATLAFGAVDCAMVGAPLNDRPGEATLERLRLIWPHSAAADRNVAAHDDATDLEREASVFEILAFTGLHPVTQWILAGLAVVLLAVYVVVTLVYVRWRRNTPRPARRRW